MATSVARRSPSGPIIRMYAQEIGRIPADPYGAAVSVGPGGRPPGTPRSPLRAEAARAAVAPRSPLRAEAARAAVAPRSPLRAEAARAAVAPRSPLRAEAARAAEAPRSPLRAEAARAAEAPRSPLRAEAATAPASLAASSPAAARVGRYGARWARAATGPTPGPPPPCGMQNVLCRFRCDTSAPNHPGRARPTRAFRFAPSTYTWPPASWTASQTCVTVSSNTPLVDG